MELRIEEFGKTNLKKIYLIHGWGLCSKVFYSIIDKIANDYHVVLVDLPGYGLNNKIPANRCNGIMQYLEETIEPNSAIFGWSLGGILALKYCIMHSSEVKCLITCSSSPKFTSDSISRWPGTDTKLLQKFSSLLTPTNCQSVIDKFLSLQAMGSETMRQDIKILKEYLKQVEAPSYYELQAGLKTLMDEDLRGYTSRIECPSLHLYGKHDRLTPYSSAQCWPHKDNTNIFCFNQSSHAPFISEPTKFNEILLDFLHKYYR